MLHIKQVLSSLIIILCLTAQSFPPGASTNNFPKGIKTGIVGADGPFAAVASLGGPVTFSTNSTTCSIGPLPTQGADLCITDSINGGTLSLDSLGNMGLLGNLGASGIVNSGGLTNSGSYTDHTGSPGSDGQVLTSVNSGLGTAWATLASIPTPTTIGQMLLSTNGSTFSLLNSGSDGLCLVEYSGLPQWGQDCPSLGGDNTFTGNNIFNGGNGTTFGNPISPGNGIKWVETASNSNYPCTSYRWLSSNTTNIVGISTTAEAMNLSDCNNNGLMQVDGAGNVGTVGTIQTLTGFIPAAATNSVIAYPWHPAIAPTCVVDAGGTTCTTTDITMPNAIMVCTANEQGTGPLFTGENSHIYVSAPGATETITYLTNAVWTAGGTITFNMTCN